MTKIKFCGLSRLCDIEAVNILRPEYIGFIFASKSRRYISPESALKLKSRLSPEIKSVGVFVNESLEKISEISSADIIDIIQLHGSESEDYIQRLKDLTGKLIIKSFIIESEKILNLAEKCRADYVLLDSGAGTGKIFNWEIIKNFPREFFLAGGLTPENVCDAVKYLEPFAVDVSSGIESDGAKDKNKMAAFISAVRKEEKFS